MKKMILAILISFIGYINVNAVQIGGIEYSMPSDVKLYNNISKTNSTAVSTATITGNEFGLETGTLYKSGIVSTTTGGYGASWCFNAPFTFMNGYIYSVNIILNNDDNKSYNTVSNDNYDMLRLGYSTTDASTHSGTTSINFFGATNDTNGLYVNENRINDSSAYILTYLFTSKLNANYICIPFKHYTNTTNKTEYFYGAHFEIIGQSDIVTNSSLNSAISNSGLARASSVNEVQSSINEVQEEINDVDSTLKEDHTYNNNSSQNIQGNQEVEELTEAEETLFDSIDLSGADVNISINPNANNLIWDIVNRLRQMNSNIVLLMTSALGLGIIKMILNR